MMTMTTATATNVKYGVGHQMGCKSSLKSNLKKNSEIYVNYEILMMSRL